MVLFLALVLFVDIPIFSDEVPTRVATDSESSPDIALPSNVLTGTLDSVLVEHTGASVGMTQIASARTDTNPNPSSEVYLPIGASSNIYSGECTNGGYLLVGAGGSADFGGNGIQMHLMEDFGDSMRILKLGG